MARTPWMTRLKRISRELSGTNSSGLSRREIVQLGLAASAGVSIGGGCRVGGDNRVIVIGGGVAGLHCAHRLVEAGVKVKVFEATDRVGGRMWTDTDTLSGRQAELGGEFIDTNHLTMHELVDEFGLTLDDRLDLQPASLTGELFWVNGAVVPDEVIVAQYTEVAPRIAAALEEADATDAGYNRLSNVWLSAFLDVVCPPEQYPELHTVLAVTYKDEYGREINEQSCLNMIYLIDSMTPDPFRVLGDSDERFHIHTGNSALPEALAAAIGEDNIVLNSPVAAVRDAGGNYEVELADGTVERAGHVVFAIPFSVLRKMDLELEELTDFKKQMIAEMGAGTNVKLVGGFSARTWWEEHNSSGLVTADLSFQTIWDSGIGLDQAGGVLTSFIGGLEGEAATDAVASFQAMLGDIDTVFPGTEAVFEGAVASHHWPSSEFSEGSYACYLPGQWEFWSFEGRRNGNLHFCGEHTSLDFQGWMEGAAETGALVAAEILDDQGKEYSKRLRDIVAAKTLAPQACYHGDRLPPRMRPLSRRRRLLDRLRRLTS